LQKIHEAFDSLPPDVIVSANGFAVHDTSPLSTYPKALPSLDTEQCERHSFKSFKDDKDGSSNVSGS
jgi:hypothetical protein